MSLITMSLAIVVPFLAAAFIPFLYKKLSHLHIGWFVLPIPLILFLALARYVPSIARGETFVYSGQWPFSTIGGVRRFFGWHFFCYKIKIKRFI